MRLLTTSNDIIYIASAESVIALDTKNDSSKQFVYESGKESQVVTVSTRHDGQKIFAGYANKQVACWSRDGELIGGYVHPKRPIGLALFSVEHPAGVTREVLVAADKAGFVTGTDFPKLSKTVALAGHTSSVITDMATDGIHIATSDRDEKVRISEFPRMDTIQSFCLGHTDVITSVQFVEVNSTNSNKKKLLVSCGWDYRIYLWDYMRGTALHSVLCEGGVSTGTAAGASDSSKDDTNASKKMRSDDADTAAAAAAAVDGADETEDVNAEETHAEEGDNDGGEDMAEKSYNEDAAGRFPIKLATAAKSPLIAVIFKNRPDVVLYKVAEKKEQQSAVSGSSSDNSDNRSASGFALEKCGSYTLPVAPCDICFLGDDKLVVLLPKPHYLSILSVSSSVESVRIAEDNKCQSAVSSFQNLCTSLGIDFSHQLVPTEEGADAERGIRKHALDRPFTKNTGIDFDKKKGAKRSRKRPAP